MSNNAVTLFDGSNPNVQNALAKLAHDAGGGKPFLRFGKDGRWTWGVEENEITDGQPMAINFQSLQLGYIAWHEGSAQERMAYIGEPGIEKADLPDVPTDQNRGWQEQRGVDLKMLSGPMAEMTFKTSSQGGREAIANLVQNIVAQIQTNPAEPVAVVHLKNTSYKHPEYGKIYKPVIEIVDWLAADGEPAKKALV
jgi:hypothetical protein